VATRTEAPSTAEVARAYFEAVGARDVEGMMSMWEPGGVGHIHGVAELVAPEGYREWFGNLFKAVPDMEFEIVEIVAEGDKAAVRWRARGNFTGDTKLEGFVATGTALDMVGCDVLTIRDGKVADNQAYTNSMDLARQMGALPPAGSTPERAMTALMNARTRTLGAFRRRRG
jgi:predicted ester cyclase